MELAVRGRGSIEIRAIYTIGRNYRDPAAASDDGPERPLVYGKATTSLAADGSVLGWDRSLTANVDGECELGVVVGGDGSALGYTIVNDVTSRDPWLDGDQWLLGKSMPGFCPVGPSIVAVDQLDPADLRLGMRLNGVDVQDGRTSQMRFAIAEILAYLVRHVRLEEGDLIATGTPVRIGPLADRPLESGDVMTCWIEHVGELTTTVVDQPRSTK